MDDYPNSDEEFELMHGDDLEMLKELDEPDRPKSRKSLHFETPTSKIKQKTALAQSQNENLNSNNSHLNNSFETDFSPIETAITDEEPSVDSTRTSGKRTVQDLFGDIDDILDEDLNQNVAKKQKTDLAADLELIDRIIELRKLAKQNQNSAILLSSHVVLSEDERNRFNLSYSVPKYSYMAVTRRDKERIYVRMHSDLYMQEVSSSLIKDCSSGFLGDAFKETWKTVKENLQKKKERMETAEPNTLHTQQVIREPNNTQLWVDMYRPRKYMELLSDESTNRVLLRWLKLWDRVVFNRRPKAKIGSLKQATPLNKFQWKQEMNLKLAQDGRPEHKVALLCGPPGLGKTTLAHILAEHAGYNIVEINASDERTTESFKHALETATQMRSVVDPDNRPNCLIFDEIDGAPAASIELLVKYVAGTLKAKPKKGGQKQQKAHVLKRPIVCICNDAFAPALRPLRQIAFIVNFPPTVPARLAERLIDISKCQMLKTDVGAMLALCDKTHNDIRSCLSVLQFFKAKGQPLTLSEVYKTSIGQMDTHKGLFQVWQDIFQIEKTRPGQNELAMMAAAAAADEDGSGGGGAATQRKPDSASRIRMNRILGTVQAFGDYERLMQGVYENYPHMKTKDSTMVGMCEALEWFSLADILSHDVHASQNYSLMAYLPYGFVVWHFIFAAHAWQKINYPSVGYEVRTKTKRNQALVTEVLHGMNPKTRTHVNGTALKLDLLPMISQIIVPSFRPVNLHLYTTKERDELLNVVNTMIDYNLNYIQERNADGAYEYKIEPNIEHLVCLGSADSSSSSGGASWKLGGSGNNRRVLSYSNKQLVAREIETQKLRRIEIGKNIGKYNGSGATTKNIEDGVAGSKNVGVKINGADAVTPNIPNHLQRLQPKMVRPKTTVTKDFFGRIIEKTSPEHEKTGPQMGNDIWFCYKEGYNNAVRKTIKIAQLK